METNTHFNEFIDNIGITATFTGHRPHKLPHEGDRNHPNTIRIIEELRQHVVKLYKEFGVKRFLCGLSKGIDVWAAQVVLNLLETDPAFSDIKLYCFIPFEDQPANWSEEDRDEYYNILSRCTDPVYVSRQYYPNCYKDRNQAMVHYARHIIAVDDPKIKMPRSGTRMTVNMGKRNGNQLWFISPGFEG